MCQQYLVDAADDTDVNDWTEEPDSVVKKGSAEESDYIYARDATTDPDVKKIMNVTEEDF